MTTSPMNSLMIRAVDVHKRFGPVEVLKGVSLDVDQGEVIAVIGPSGSGKSTFLRCLIHLETIHRGSIDIEGEALVATDAQGHCRYVAARRHQPRLPQDGHGVPALQPVSRT